jgi:hypothetical protein
MKVTRSDCAVAIVGGQHADRAAAQCDGEQDEPPPALKVRRSAHQCDGAEQERDEAKRDLHLSLIGAMARGLDNALG